MNGVPTAEADAEEAVLWHRVRSIDDADARSVLLARHLPYAKVIAAMYYARRYHDDVAFEEYLQLARLGLLEAFERYDPGRGAQFRTYAARCMHGTLVDGLAQSTERQDQAAARRRLLGERTRSLAAQGSVDTAAGGGGVSEADGECEPPVVDDVFGYLAEVGIGLALGFMLEDTGMIRPPTEPVTGPDAAYKSLELRQTRQRLTSLIDCLSPAEREVIHGHYLQQMPFVDIAASLALTKGRVSQIHKQALQTLRLWMTPQAAADVSF